MGEMLRYLLVAALFVIVEVIAVGKKKKKRPAAKLHEPKRAAPPETTQKQADETARERARGFEQADEADEFDDPCEQEAEPRIHLHHADEQAMEQAIDECIRTGILSDFLRKSRAEVMRMWLFEYDQEKHIEMEKEESYEDGKREYLITLVVKLKNKGKTVDEIADILEEPVEKIQKICEISENYAPDYDAQKIYQELENSEY